jgi:peroxiredoxin
VGRIVPAPDLGERLSPITLASTDGGEVSLGSLWADRMVVLIHLRHFGCILCRHFAARLRDRHGEFEALGAEVAAIGTGGRTYARAFVEDREIRYPVLVDKELESHGIVEIKRGPPWGILAPNVLASAGKALRYGERQGRTGPHPWVFGAVHIFDPGGVPRYGWINDNYNDNPSIDDLIAVAAAPAATAE